MLVLVERPADNPLPSQTKLSPEECAQFESLVGKYAGLLPVLVRPSNAPFAAMALAGALALQAGRIIVARDIHEQVTFRTSNFTAVTYVMEGVLIFVASMAVLFLLSFLILFAVAILSHKPDTLLTMPSFPSEFVNVLVCFVFGCFGSVVSLLLQLRDFEILKGKSLAFLRALGGTQPVIGGIFACVVGAVFSAKLINISVGGSTDPSIWLFVVLGFLAGLSERFSKNLLHVAASHLGGTTEPPTQLPQQRP